MIKTWYKYAREMFIIYQFCLIRQVEIINMKVAAAAVAVFLMVGTVVVITEGKFEGKPSVKCFLVSMY